MIKRFCVTGLNGSMDFDLSFNKDINILTGKNGSGKTTILKLMWFMFSPNIERTVPEITFKTAHLATDIFTLDISRKLTKNREKVTITFKEADKKPLEYEVWASEFHDPSALENVEQVNIRIYNIPNNSVFFPTFRIIEGGFSLEQQFKNRRLPSSQISQELNSAIANYSKRMTVRGHKFVASISSGDIQDLLTGQFADSSEQTSLLHNELSTFISSTISRQQKKTKSEKSLLEQLSIANTELENIRKKVVDIEERRTCLMQPFNVLSDVIGTIFKDKGIKISDILTLGETRKAIDANILSAGEKQMLCFLCYNAFTHNSPIFIDEPELSLHVDWQRMLFPTLLSQNTDNQFFVSTHSPFIYSKYPEKELILDIDRGENQCR